MSRLFPRTTLVALLVASLFLGGISMLGNYENFFTSVELNISEYSPNGAGGGKLIPASCPSDLHDEPSYGQGCTSAPNACGQINSGSIQCGGSCSAGTPANPPGYGDLCNSPANSCGATNQGTIQCNGSCSAQFAPPNPPNYGDICTSNANSCGLRNIGTITCNGSCSITAAPSESLCPNINIDDACVNLTANPNLTGPNGFSTLTWSATCGSGQICTLYNMDTGAVIATSTSGNKQVGPISVVTDYALTCDAFTDYVTVSPSNAGSGTFQEF